MSVEKFTVECQGPEHYGVHEHPADERWCSSLIQAGKTFFSYGLGEALYWTVELGGIAGLETDFYSVEGVSNYNTY